MEKLKVLNGHAGIGGNRRLWKNVEVTAVEIVPEVAEIYQKLYPEDKVIVGDIKKYLLEHYKEFDFIWLSPPCPTHSRMRFLKMEQNAKPVLPDMELYGYIIFLQTWFKGKFVVENVISYYEPLIMPYVSENHYFWSNFHIDNLEKKKRGLIRTTQDNRIDFMQNNYNIDLSTFDVSNSLKSKVLSNCVNPSLGLHIFNSAFKTKQLTINDNGGTNFTTHN
jgi:DNA (cytosine-5)-methyltransferase 1